MNFKAVNLAADNFKVEGPNVSAAISELAMATHFGLKIENLKAGFSFTQQAMAFEDLQLVTKGSLVQGQLRLNYKEGGLADFVNQVEIDATFKKSNVATNDLNNFYNEFGSGRNIALAGTLKGNLNNFSLNRARVTSGGTQLYGNYTFVNLVNGNPLRITAKNHRIRSSFYDLSRFMPRILGQNLPGQLKHLGDVGFVGNTTLTQTELSTQSTLTSEIGNATLLLNMQDYSNSSKASYSGSAVLEGFNLGALTENASLGTVTADVAFNGNGFTQQSLNTEITGDIGNFGLQGYNYKNISVSGNLKNPKFEGHLKINDPNLKMDFKGLVDVTGARNRYDFTARVEYAELNKLNLVARDSIAVFAGNIVMNMNGTTINDATGTIGFTETFYQNETDDFYFDDFLVTSTFQGPVRTIAVVSPDIIKGDISGEFKVEEIPSLFQNSISSLYSNYIPRPVAPGQYIDYQFKVFNKIIDVFVPQLELGENTNLKGTVASNETKFQLDFRSPEMLLQKNYLGTVKVQIDNDNPLYNTFVSIDSVYTGTYNAVDFTAINKTHRDTLFIQGEFKGGKKKEDLFDLALYHTINPEGRSVVGLRRSKITYKENTWFINKNNNAQNKVTFDGGFTNFKIDPLVLNHNNEYIRMAGVVRDSTFKDIKVRFQNVNIGNIAPDVDSLRLKGNVNGKLDFLQNNGAYYPNSSITVDDVVINETAFGDLVIQVKGNKDLTQYDINTTLTNNNVRSINAVGRIDVSARNPQVNIDVALQEFNLQAFSPFGGEVITDIRGLATGNARVRGNYKRPDISGRVRLEQSGLKIPYLNTDFNLEENTTVTISQNSLSVAPTTITDTKYNTTGTFSGSAAHTNFLDWGLNMNISTGRLLVLDTPPDDEALYYGTAFISGTADIFGPVDELVINVAATTEEGTTFKVPISDTESIGDASFIHFLSPKEKQALIIGETIVTEEVKGLELNFDLDINQNAEVEVVVDKVNNSTIKGRGAGNLLLEINTLGKFNMWGDFLVIDGTYDFRYSGIIQKKFDVLGGGNINWEGDPTRAQLDISAQYTTEANPSVLLDNPSFNRKIPVQVIVDLTGEILKPNLNFRIDFPRASSIVRSELDYKLQSEEERQKQALFLVGSDSFVDDDYQGNNALTGTLMNRVSGLVNELFAGQDSKFRVGLDYQQGSRSPNQETADRFGITLSTEINERILINGKVGVPVGGVNETTVAGDIEVQWLVNEDGSLRMKFFNRQADIQFIGEEQIFEQGSGMSYSVDFDTFSELVNKLFNKKLSLQIDGPPTTPNDNNTAPVH
ncbi:MAG: translocation/assembly module TamB domain-containing protein, partial [Marinirhabdus sp.]